MQRLMAIKTTSIAFEKNYSVEQQLIRQDQRASDWAKRNGFSWTKIQSHPFIEEIALLLEFDEHHIWFTQKDADIWTHCWQWCYKHEHQLTNYHRKKLLSIIDGIEYRRQQYQNRQLKRQHIQQRIAKRQNKLAAV